MNFEIKNSDQKISITINGPMDLFMHNDFTKEVMDVTSNNEKAVEIDLLNVDYIDSSGVALLIKLCKAQKERSLKFDILNASERVSAILELSSLKDFLS